MAQIENLPIVLTGLGLTVSILYYTITLRNANKTQQQQLDTRQAQLFMQIYSIYDSKDFLNDYTDVCWRHEYTDIDDWMKKYHPQKNPEAYASFMRLGRFYEGVGILVEKNLISLDIVVELMSEAIIFSWDRLKVYAYGQRELTKMPIWEHFEALVNMVKARRAEAISADQLLKTTKDISSKQ